MNKHQISLWPQTNKQDLLLEFSMLTTRYSRIAYIISRLLTRQVMCFAQLFTSSLADVASTADC